MGAPQLKGRPLKATVLRKIFPENIIPHILVGMFLWAHNEQASQ